MDIRNRIISLPLILLSLSITISFASGCAINNSGLRAITDSPLFVADNGLKHQDNDNDKTVNHPSVLCLIGTQYIDRYEYDGQLNLFIHGVKGTYPISDTPWSFDWGFLRLNYHSIPESTSLAYASYEIDGFCVPLAARCEIRITDWFRPFLRAGITYQFLKGNDDYVYDTVSVYSYMSKSRTVGLEAGGGLRFLYHKLVFEFGIDLGTNRDSMNIEDGYFMYPTVEDYMEDRMDSVDFGPQPRIYITLGLEF
ncbi:MAG: hypothetical protein E3J72_08355 [Planctomycetota bacterium]|nr:MAG: hypothetical protein E3J72_08355 [Planctomycetota bacterium]